MAGILINTDQVIKAGQKAEDARKKTKQAKSNVDNLRNQISRNIQDRKNIASRLKEVSEELSDVNSSIAEIKKLTDNGAMSYRNTDNKLKKVKFKR